MGFECLLSRGDCYFLRKGIKQKSDERKEGK
jgi:hypothetical protein